jgi:hypothetical protein
LISDFWGGLMQVWVGIGGGTGVLRTKRSGFAWYAARQDVLAGGMDDLGLAEMHLIRRHQSDADVMVILVVQVKKRRQNARASSMQPKRLENCGWISGS